MRSSLPLLISVLALAACEDSQSTTAPTPRDGIAPPTAVAQASSGGPIAQGKPVQGPAITVTVVTSAEVAGAGGMAKSIECPAGTVRTGGGYLFTNEGNWDVPPVVTQSYPTPNGWWVRAIMMSGGAFKVYALCAS